MELRKAHLAMIRAFPGGWDAMSAALAMKRDALENRIYERKGQSTLTETSLQMQSFSQTTYFAQAVAALSGGVFMLLPAASEVDREDLLGKFNELYAKLGALAGKFQEAASDGEIDKGERADIATVGQEIHRTLEELLALTFKIYCREE